jgi:hypothetical protein
VTDLVLPAFEMDCREWLVNTPASVGLPEEIGGAPLLAVLSTVLVADGDFREASGVLTVGLLDEEAPETRPVSGGSVAVQLLGAGGADDADDADGAGDCVPYVLPAPDGHLALLAEFQLPRADDAEMIARIESLMASFRWAA